jgi:hypothetical protein
MNAWTLQHEVKKKKKKKAYSEDVCQGFLSSEAGT